MDEELQGRVDFLEQQLRKLQDELIIRGHQDAYIMTSLSKKNLAPNLTMDLMFAGNLVWNSSFEMPKEGVKPDYWTAGISSTEKAFTGHVSLKLAPAQTSEQEAAAYIPVSAFADEQIRVTFAQVGGKLKCQVVDQSGAVMLSHDSNPADSWYNGRRTFTLLPGPATSVHLRFTNIDSTNAVYIDAVQVEPDVLRKWPSLYMDGPKSGAYASEAATGGGSGATPTVLVAASTASAKLKAAADYVCDGVSDEVEINAALALGGRIVLTDGTFKVTNPIDPGIGSVVTTQLMGMGQGITMIVAQNAMPSVLGTGYAPTGLIVRDLEIYGSSLAVVGINFNADPGDCVIEHVIVSYCTGDGFALGATSSASGAVVRNCLSRSNGGAGFVMGGWWSEASTCVADSNGSYGFYLRFIQESMIYQCYAHNNSNSGFFVTDFSKWVTILNCRSSFNTPNGIETFGDVQSLISNNSLRGNRLHNIYLNGSNQSKVCDNMLLEAGGGSSVPTGSNIQIVGGQSSAVNGNLCRSSGSAGSGMTQYGINIVSGTQHWVANNDLLGSGRTAGLVDNGTGTIRDPGNRLKNGTWSTLTG